MSYFWCLEKVDKIPHKIVKKRSRIRLCFLKKSVKKSEHHLFYLRFYISFSSSLDSCKPIRNLSCRRGDIDEIMVFQDSVDDNSSRRPQNKKIPTGLFFFGSLFHVQQFIAILEELNFSRCFTYTYGMLITTISRASYYVFTLYPPMGN